jgi:hypothetical protein
MWCEIGVFFAPTSINVKACNFFENYNFVELKNYFLIFGVLFHIKSHKLIFSSYLFGMVLPFATLNYGEKIYACGMLQPNLETKVFGRIF